MKLRFETIVDCHWMTIKNLFDRNLFLALAPPVIGMKLERFDGCSPGNEVHILLNSFGVEQKWVSVITQETLIDAEWSFTDEGRIMPWPLQSWKHIHRVVSLDATSSKIIDDISFDCGFYWVNVMMFPFLWASFSIRPSRYKKFFQGR